MTLELVRSQRKFAFVAAFVCAASSVLAQGTTQAVVVPFGFENQNGNSNDGIFESAGHFQELFRATSFTSEWKTPVAITGIAFRVADGVPLSLQATVPQLEIRFSTSSHAPENMSTIYGANKGADETTVFLHDNVSLFGRAGQPVNPFDIAITFDQPFVYDPKLGNLLMYVTASAIVGRGTQIDAHGYGSLDVSPASYVGSTGPFGDFQVVPYSLVTEFSWIAVPEPSALSLIGMALACLAAKSLGRRSFHPIDGATTQAAPVEH